MGADLNVVAIATSVNYSDYLRFCLASLQYAGIQAYVITEQYDSAIEMAGRFGATAVVFDGWRSGGALFNKAGAIRHAQKLVHKDHPDAWYLIVDADIVMERDARQIINEHVSDESAIYSTRRIDFRTQADLLAGKAAKTYGGMFSGFWQLYRRHVLYPEWSRTAEGCDLTFAAQFQSARVLPMVVAHCGQEGVNWEGRRSPMW